MSAGDIFFGVDTSLPPPRDMVDTSLSSGPGVGDRHRWRMPRGWRCAGRGTDFWDSMDTGLPGCWDTLPHPCPRWDGRQTFSRLTCTRFTLVQSHHSLVRPPLTRSSSRRMRRVATRSGCRDWSSAPSPRSPPRRPASRCAPESRGQHHCLSHLAVILQPSRTARSTLHALLLSPCLRPCTTAPGPREHGRERRGPRVSPGSCMH